MKTRDRQYKYKRTRPSIVSTALASVGQINPNGIIYLCQYSEYQMPKCGHTRNSQAYEQIIWIMNQAQSHSIKFMSAKSSLDDIVGLCTEVKIENCMGFNAFGQIIIVNCTDAHSATVHFPESKLISVFIWLLSPMMILCTCASLSQSNWCSKRVF